MYLFFKIILKLNKTRHVKVNVKQMEWHRGDNSTSTHVTEMTSNHPLVLIFIWLKEYHLWNICLKLYVWYNGLKDKYITITFVIQQKEWMN